MQAEKEKTDKRQQSYYCEVLNQKFSNYTTFSNRLTTKKYKQALEEAKNKTPKPEEVEVIVEKPEPEVVEGNILSEQAFKKKKTVLTTLDKISICLFTNTEHNSFEENLKQMRLKFNFCIPDENCCKKKEDLIRFLAQQIQKENSCIYCFKRFKGAESTQQHVVEKQHTLMNEEYFGQYEQFYDFREENRRIAREMAEKFKNYPKENNLVYRIKSDPNQKIKEDTKPAVEGTEGDDDEWEDDEISETEPQGRVKKITLETTAKKLFEKFSIRRARRLETGELLLPNGKIAGHRAYFRYYKQQLRSRQLDRKPLDQILSDPNFTKNLSPTEQQQLVAFSKKLGETTLSLSTYNHFLNKIKIKADKARRGDTARIKRNYVRIGVEAKKLQKYFRDRNIIFG
jgi:C2H2 type zinc-finger (2 copies)